MLTVIFGAGASYDSATSHPPDPQESVFWPAGSQWRLPLAKQLFDERGHFSVAAGNFDKLLAIIHELRHVPTDASVEQQLQRLSEEPRPAVKMQLAAVRFYLQWIIRQCQLQWNGIIGGSTNYRALLNQIERYRFRSQIENQDKSRVCLVTFNYDTLLEDAFGSIARPGRFDSTDGYIMHDDYVLIKLHGSVDWVHEIEANMEFHSNVLHDTTSHIREANNLIEIADKLEPQITTKYHIIPRTLRNVWPISGLSIPGKSGHQVVYPAIAIPVVSKQDYECPVEHARVLEDCIRETSKLIIIGWRAAEEKFMKLLADALPRNIPVAVVSRNVLSANEIRNTLGRSIQTEKWSSFAGSFTEFIRQRAIENL